MAAWIKMAVFWVVAPCSVVEVSSTRLHGATTQKTAIFLQHSSLPVPESRIYTVTYFVADVHPVYSRNVFSEISYRKQEYGQNELHEHETIDIVAGLVILQAYFLLLFSRYHFPFIMSIFTLVLTISRLKALSDKDRFRFVSSSALYRFYCITDRLYIAVTSCTDLVQFLTAF
jgi:hypothetical protein